mmetsp:Transcript_20183/g.35910  ORF Transcript_20183/g.35910 Transcript_20183/m.35910 type:complete len:444 (-) Transcript_20183:282-1613(-)|eukprot:CAMPEP_0197662096 /NCGR_PEP_ID=MMETSP1338-20131121/52105_1 /TAXON_ID=43686 ORGANISM="Pelagodinium beii, Strain RCC1491" /NCGR_SAMPLE_ID=MMETSP1338 /ASSEMBLY_ACC=CAM_ASM_000754 /LENGTH=443 /DNA_ID=CAMNT_0043239805 /DNA_START=57 /DNA_END=1388 /DNA_ORIENTATION=+
MAIEGINAGDTAWILAASAFVLLMTPGLAFFYGGLSQHHHVLNTMLMSFTCMGVVSVIWFTLGFSLAFSGGNVFIGGFSYAGLAGLDSMLWPGTTIPALLFVTFQMTFAIISAAIISGGIAERMRFSAFIVFIALWSILVYCPVCHWVWGPNGWVADMGAIDFAGGTVIHEITAVTALVVAFLLGPREGVRELAQKPEPHHVPQVLLGGGLLWFGWSGFNAGSAIGADESAALALINTYLSAATSLVMWTVIERAVDKRVTAVGTVTGAVVGLVLITPAAGFVNPLGSVIMGAIGSALTFPAFKVTQWIQHVVDDSLDVFPCHGVASIVGTVLTGAFATDGGLFYGGGFSLMGKQALAALATGGYAALVSLLIVLAMRLVMRLRVEVHEELGGIDYSVHGQKAYHTSVSAYGTEVSTTASNTSVSTVGKSSTEAGEASMASIV